MACRSRQLLPKVKNLARQKLSARVAETDVPVQQALAGMLETELRLFDTV